MFKYYPGGKAILALIAILIIAASLLYVDNLARKMAGEERKKMQLWVEANKEILTAPADANLNLASEIIANNKTIPIILTDKSGKVLYTNLDSQQIARDPQYVEKQLELFRVRHPPIVQEYNPKNREDRNYVYYGDSTMLKQLRYYPYVQLFIVALFILVTLIALTNTSRATQNQVWVGLAKETAHQLGTPLSSIEAWMEILKEHPGNAPIVAELGKDLDRLKLISERFSKIGSTPVLEEHNLVSQVTHMVNYIRKRAPQKVGFEIETHGEDDIPAMISPLLFDWVIENLLKNALDAMEGSGRITITISNRATETWIDVADTGKGIPRTLQAKVFKPGFSTKKRGWGLGLSLSKRIIETYHKGKLSIKSSEAGKGTTFRVLLRK
ncbi:HAMP domain-containing sensor histidine kinase [Compostibacter hankyongensis]|uniref:histidine kinase n=1 Tax=Compostibacter hankyongensis TaxID=1007089 RepID=A0ABP8FZ17_9BACT